jgi:Tol biopolymer transport system component
VSVTSAGAQGAALSGGQEISANGRYVTFHSDAALVASDSNGVSDVYVHDRKTRKTKRVSVRSNGNQGNGASRSPSISANGRYVAFESDASNLVAHDSDDKTDIFVHDRKTKRTKRVSIRTLVTAVAGTLGDSRFAAISGNGRFVAFRSQSTILVNFDTNGHSDVFVHDRKKFKTKRISIRTNGAQGDGGSSHPAISFDGRFVAFESHASTLVANDSNDEEDTFLRDRKKKRTTRVSVSTGGTQGNGEADDPSISANGRFIAFESSATNLVGKDDNAEQDVFIHDRVKHKTRLVSKRTGGGQGSSRSADASVSETGRYVAFDSAAPDLVGSDSNGAIDSFIHDRRTNKTRRVSKATGGAQADADSEDPKISADGRFVTFSSSALNLVPFDTNGVDDVFRRGPLL